MKNNTILISLILSLTILISCEKRTSCRGIAILKTNFYGIAFYKIDSVSIQPKTGVSRNIVSVHVKYDTMADYSTICATRSYYNGILPNTFKLYCSRDIVMPDILIPAMSDISGYTSEYFKLSQIGLQNGSSTLFYVAHLSITQNIPNKEMEEGLYTFYTEAQSVNGNQYKDSISVYLRY